MFGSWNRLRLLGLAPSAVFRSVLYPRPDSWPCPFMAVSVLLRGGWPLRLGFRGC